MSPLTLVLPRNQPVAVLVDFRSSGKLRGDKPVHVSRLSATSPLRRTSMVIGPLLTQIGRRKGLDVDFQRLARRTHTDTVTLAAKARN